MSLADTLMAAAGRLSPFEDEADLRAAPEDLSSASDSGSQTAALHNGAHLAHQMLCDNAGTSCGLTPCFVSAVHKHPAHCTSPGSLHIV